MNIQPYFGAGDFEKDELWSRLLDLTYAVWRVADVALEHDSFKEKIKQSALNILERYPNISTNEAVRTDSIERMYRHIALLSMAQKISLARDINFLILKNEYRKIIASITPPVALEHRQERVVSQPVIAQTVDQTAVPQKEERIPEQKQKDNIKTPRPEKENFVSDLNDRQMKILQLFNKRKDDRIKLKDVAQFFPELTDRTIRNDLRDMCTKKIVSRSDGHGQASYYFLVKK